MSHTESHLETVEELFRNRNACDRVMRMLSLFSNEIRFKILVVLKEGDFCVNDIVRIVDGKRSNISQQLKMLTLAGYLTKQRREKSIIYHLADEQIRGTVQYLCDNFKDTTQREEITTWQQ